MLSPFQRVILFIVVSLIGLAMIPRLHVDLQPNYSLPRLVVSYTLPDAPPEVVEQEATAPLENILSQLPELEQITSVSHYNQGNIVLEFSKRADLAFKRFEVSSIIRQIYPKLHPSLSYPLIEQRDPRQSAGKASLLIYRIYAPNAPFQIQATANDVLRPTLAREAGISAVDISGANALQLSIRYRPEKLQAYGLTRQAVANTLHEHYFRMYPGAYVSEAGQKLYVQADFNPESLEDIAALPLKVPSGEVISLSEIAAVYVEETKPRSYFRINGQNAITLSIQAEEGVNKLLLGNKIKQQVSQLARSLPEGYTLLLEYDDTEYLQKELDKIYLRSGLSVVILCCFIFFINRSPRYLLVVFTGIIVTLCLTLLVAALVGLQVHLYTIAGLTISFGLIVDNAIVMVDHIHRKRNLHIFKALLAATATTVVALTLVFTLPEEEQVNLIDFCLVVSIALGLSLVTALLYTPAVYHLLYGPGQAWVKPRKQLRWKVRLRHYYSRMIYFLVRYRKTFITLVILMFGLPLFMLPSKWEGHSWYNATIGSSLYQDNLRPYVDKWSGGALRLFVRNVFEKSGYRTPEKTRLYIHAELPFGHTLEQMNEVMQAVEQYLSEVEGLDQYITRIYTGQRAQVEIHFLPGYDEGSLPYILKGRLIARSLDWGGVEWSVYGVGKGFSNRSGGEIPSFRVTMKGYNYEELERQAERMAEKLLLHKRIQKVNTNERLSWNERSSSELVLQLPAHYLAGGGFTTAELATILRDLGPSQRAEKLISLDGSFYPVHIGSIDGDDFSRYHLQNKSLENKEGRSLQLLGFSELNLQRTANSIHKENRQYIRLVGFEYFGSHKFGSEYLDEVLAEMDQEMPLGYEAKKMTWQWTWDKVKRQYGLLFLLLVGIFMICAILFESLRQPFFIILTVPLSFIGLFVTFAWFDFYFDQGGYAAFILLGGLVVNASIFILNDFNTIRKIHPHKALLKAVAGKTSPILLTVLSTCFGLIPFLLEGQNEVFWFSLAAGTIGGLLFSLFAVFVFLPVVLLKRSAA